VYCPVITSVSVTQSAFAIKDTVLTEIKTHIHRTLWTPRERIAEEQAKAMHGAHFFCAISSISSREALGQLQAPLHVGIALPLQKIDAQLSTLLEDVNAASGARVARDA